MNIAGNTFIITGAARGLGLAMAQSLSQQNANVMLADMDEQTLQAALKSLPENSGNQLTCTTNVADEQSVINLCNTTESLLGPIAGIVNNAGILRDGLLAKSKEGEVIKEMTLEQWQAVIDVNLTGVFLCGREAAKRMISSATEGVIINISSISRVGNAGQSNYSAAKAGVAALTVTWAAELARHGIRSAAIAPGVFDTEMVALMKPEAHDKLVSAIPLKRTGKLSQLADAVDFIIKNDYYTGRILELDGGLRL